MNSRTDQKQLLADVLATEAEPGFSAGVLAATLRQARRRRRIRQVRRIGGALVALLVVALVTGHWLRRGPQSELARLPHPTGYQLVVSQPLTPDQVVSTRALAPDQTVVSAATAHLIQTTPGGFGEIGDDELMALAAPNVVALVRRSPHDAELVFVPAPPENAEVHPN
jgi:hypothetical protein